MTEQTANHPRGTTSPNPGSSRKLLRASEPSERLLGGVSAGVGSYLGLKTNHVRIVFLILTPLFLLGVMIYVAVWLFAPDTNGRVLVRSGAQSSTECLLAAAFATVAMFGFLAWIPSGEPSSGTAFNVALLTGVATALLSAPSRSRNDDINSSQPGDQHQYRGDSSDLEQHTAPVLEEQPTDAPATAVLPSVAPTSQVTATRRSTQIRPSKPPRPRPFMGPLIVACSMIVAGIGLLLRGLTDIPVQLSDVLIGVLIVMGLGMVITTWFGRARGIIVLGVALIPVTLMAATVDRLGIGTDFGADVYTPSRTIEIPALIELDGGSVDVDLRLLEDTPTEPVNMDITVRFGTIRVLVPASWNVQVETTTRFGSLHVFDEVWVEPEYTEEQLLDESFEPEWPPWNHQSHSREQTVQSNPTVMVHSPRPVSVSERTNNGAVYRAEHQSNPSAPTLVLRTSSIISDVEVIRADHVESYS